MTGNDDWGFDIEAGRVVKEILMLTREIHGHVRPGATRDAETWSPSALRT